MVGVTANISSKDLGASEAFLDISDAGVTLRMTMLAGNVVTQSAEVVEAHVVKGEGYWIAQWPDEGSRAG
jgi:hypothetical protein